MNKSVVNFIKRSGLALLAACIAGCSSSDPPAQSPAPELTKIRLSIDADSFIPRLGASLGYFAQEGLEIEEVSVVALSGKDYLLQQPLRDGRLDASLHWFQHAVFGARHGLPVKAVLMFNDAPGMTVLVANSQRGEIRTAADFKGRKIAEGAAYATKSKLMNYLAVRAGLPQRSYTAVAKELAGRQEAVVEGFKQGTVDVAAFMEPMTSAIMETNLVTPLYDLTSRQSTTAVFGAALPSEALLMSEAFIREKPELAQRIVNAFVRTMRYINSHSAEDIVANLPASYLADKDRQAETDRIRKILPTFAQGDYSFSEPDARLLVDTIEKFSFDDSEPGRWRGTAIVKDIDVQGLFDNTLVHEAMRNIP